MMKIYLMENGEWKLFLNPDIGELHARGIKIGNYAEIGYSAKIGNYAEIGDSAEIGYYAEIGYSAKIGDSAEIGYYAKIGNYAKITKMLDVFTPEYIYCQLQTLPDSVGGYTLYKSLNPDGSCFWGNGFKYFKGMEWQDNSLIRDQSVECGEGCHFTTYDRAVAFAEGKEHIIISAKIHLDDILSVYQKVRVKAFWDVRIIKLNF